VINASTADIALLNQMFESVGGTFEFTDQSVWAAQIVMAFVSACSISPSWQGWAQRAR
jgi:hypothetical protein